MFAIPSLSVSQNPCSTKISSIAKSFPPPETAVLTKCTSTGAVELVEITVGFENCIHAAVLPAAILGRSPVLNEPIVSIP